MDIVYSKNFVLLTLKTLHQSAWLFSKQRFIDAQKNHFQSD